MASTSESPRLRCGTGMPAGDELPDGCVPMAGTSMGCVLLRGAALEVPFAYHRDERTGVHGEDVGYLRVANERGLRMCALGRYEVRHLDA